MKKLLKGMRSPISLGVEGDIKTCTIECAKQLCVRIAINILQSSIIVYYIHVQGHMMYSLLVGRKFHFKIPNFVTFLAAIIFSLNEIFVMNTQK